MPSPVEKLQKFLILEKDRGYDNRAVVGGLDKIVTSWKSEAESNKLPREVIDQVCLILTVYPSEEPESRAVFVDKILQLIDKLENANNEDAVPAQNRQPVPRPDGPARSPRTRSTVERSRPGLRKDEQPVGLNASLTVLPGIGVKNAQYFKQLEINTLGDLLFYFPRRYDDYSHLKPD